MNKFWAYCKVIYDWLRTVHYRDLIFFFVVMFLKVVVFSFFIKARNMSMNVDDVIVALGTFMMITFWTLWLPRRIRVAALLSMNLFFSVVMFADLLYFRYFQDIISIPVILQANQVGDLGGSILTLIRLSDITFFLDLSIILFFAIRGMMRRQKEKLQPAPIHKLSNIVRYRRMLIRFSLSLIILALGTTLVFIPVTQAKNTWAQRLFANNFWNVSLYNVTGIIGFHGYDLFRYANENWFENKPPLTPKEIAETRNLFKKKQQIRQTLQRTDRNFGRYEGKNVIVVQLETYQNYLINFKLNGQPLTPNLNALLDSSLYFDNFYHQTNQGRTSDADLGANFSMYPLQTGSVFIRYGQNEFDSTPRVLNESGYSSFVFHAYDAGFWNRQNVYEKNEYMQFYSKKDFVMDEPIGWSLGDKSFFRQSVEAMASKRQPFYSFLISISTHNPYELPEDMPNKFDVGPQLEGTLLGNYLQAAHYVDQAVGELITDLKREGLWDSSIVMLYGDHDTSITDMGLYTSLFGRSLGEQEFVEMMREVPLIVHLPDEAMKGVRHEVGGQLDLEPTILHMLGIPSDQRYLIGTPLVIDKPITNKRVLFRNGSYTDGRIWFYPAEDGSVENNRCLQVGTGEPANPLLCNAQADVEKELLLANRFIEYNLLPVFRNQLP